MRCSGVTTALLLTLGVLPSVESQESDHLYAVQVDTAAERGFVEAVAGALETDGYSPVWVESILDGYAVFFGRFAVEAEARVYHDYLVDTERSDRERADVIALTHGEPASNTGRFTAIFGLDERPLDAEGLAFEPAACPIAPGGVRTEDPDSFPQLPETPGEALLDEIAQGIDDPARGAELLALARERAPNPHNGGFHARALAKPVADGSVAASRDDRYQAMWLVARIYHAMGWRRAAFRAYSEIETVADDPRDLARIGVEKAGLTMELFTVREGIGSMPEVRIMCDRVTDRFAASEDPEIIQHCATARLMRAESFSHEGNEERAIEDLGLLAADESIPVRERGMAAHFLAHTLRREGQLAAAEARFERLAEMQVPPEENFPGYDVSQQALATLVSMAADRGDATTAQRHFMAMADEGRPNRHLLRAAHDVLGCPGISANAIGRAQEIIASEDD